MKKKSKNQDEFVCENCGLSMMVGLECQNCGYFDLDEDGFDDLDVEEEVDFFNDED